MSTSQARYQATLLPVTSSTKFGGYAVGGFLCLTSGTLSFTDNRGNVTIPAFPVTAGTWLALPLIVTNSSEGFYAITAGGASGMLAT